MKIQKFLFGNYFILSSLFFATFFTSYSQQVYNNHFIDSIFKNKIEVYFSFYLENKAELNNLSKIISIDKIENDSIFAYANKLEFSKFSNLNYSFSLLPLPSSLIDVEMISEIKTGSKFSWDYYPTYTAYENLMKQFAIDFPDICSLHCIDTLPSGRLLLAVKISDNVDTDEDEPEFLYTASMHGDELTCYVVTLRFIDYLLANYDINSEITDIINNVEIWINPLANPDGAYAGGNNTITGATRYNSNGVDLNRNYPDPEDGPHPDYMAWQPETVAFMEFAAERDFVMAANFHGGAELFNYPWDTWSQLHADDNWWQFTGREYADTAQFYSPTGYFDDEDNGITNGYAWYTTSGSRQDYMNYFEHCREVTIEISANKIVATNMLNAYWNFNYRSMLNYLKQVTYGLQGKVIDACTGKGVEAKVFITSHDKDNSHIFSSKQSGKYFRPLYEGTYSITYSATGYQSITISNISINNYSTFNQDIYLQQIQPLAYFTADSSINCTGIVSFDNKSIAPSDSTIFTWYFGDGNFSNEKNPTHKYNYNGSFNVKLVVNTSCGLKDSIVKNSYININMPAAPDVTDGESCGPAVLNLSATGNGLLNWYYSVNDTVPFYVGNSYVTNLLDSSQIYYIEDNIMPPAIYVGKTDNNGNGTYFSSFGQDYLVFDCYKEIELVSVKVYAQNEGIRSIYLLDAYDNIIDSKDINILQGESRINLNFQLPVGNNLKLAGAPGAGLYRNSSGVNFPYTVTGVLSITTGSDIYNPTKYYFYFYDWELQESSCISQRVPINAYINDTAPTADFTFYETSLDVQFNSLSTNANNYYWNFGDGNISTLQNPMHNYATSGFFTIKHKVTNACGVDSVSKQIQITSIYENSVNTQINIYPNPANDYLYVDIININNSKNICNYSIYDITGRKINQDNIILNTNRTKTIIDISNLSIGLYILKIHSEEFTINSKFLIDR